jgi:peptidoglycan hydrolase-like protein with peptidoglycan-binding domain
MIRLKHLNGLVLGTLLAGNVAYADFGDAVVGGLVGGAVGSVITNEVYNSNRSESTTTHRRHHKSTQKRRYTAPRNTPEMKIQSALSSLGFYHGRIDGEINSFETRSAIKAMNQAYEISNSASLKPEARDALIYLGTLFQFDRYLIARGSDTRTKGRKIQTALKIHGFYFSKIDGVVGRGTREAIARYKAANGLSYGSSLDFEEEYQLVSSAKQMNDKNIDDTIASLKELGAKQVAAPVQNSQGVQELKLKTIQ